MKSWLYLFFSFIVRAYEGERGIPANPVSFCTYEGPVTGINLHLDNINNHIPISFNIAFAGFASAVETVQALHPQFQKACESGYGGGGGGGGGGGDGWSEEDCVADLTKQFTNWLMNTCSETFPQSRHVFDNNTGAVDTLPCDYVGYVPKLKLETSSNTLFVQVDIKPQMLSSIDELYLQIQPQISQLCSELQVSTLLNDRNECENELKQQAKSWLMLACGTLYSSTMRTNSVSYTEVSTESVTVNSASVSQYPLDLSLEWQSQPTSPCLIIYHCPKASGSSLIAWLQSQGLSVWLYYKSLHQTPTYLSPPLNADVYIGHWGPSSITSSFQEFLVERGMTDRKCFEMTLLREPIQLSLSSLFYRQGHKHLNQWDNMQYEEQFEVLTTVMKDISKDRRGGDYSNQMCRQFSGLISTWDMSSFSYMDNWQHTCNVSQAKIALSQLDFVGFADQRQTMYAFLSDLFALSRSNSSDLMLVEQMKWNKSQNPINQSLIPTELISLVKQANEDDIALYKWATEHYRGSGIDESTE